ncbi:MULTISPECIES: cell wall hydrolase [unclassified Sphingomonas]|uniref:cell wall hydrolase n=1 Tax=unclassified Sphingomonas TaxID=196159 RepID=UPI002456320E|nr:MULTISPECIES: cell wall hydrolase [unclassified Sphingomonas]MDH4746762.1 cell wall hydrolase [Sphingomonas sp. CBMAI 2297]
MATVPSLPTAGAFSVRVPPMLVALLGLVTLTAIALPLWLVTHTPRAVVHKRAPVKVSHRVVPKTELPEVEPVELQVVTPDDARAWNASIPFSNLPNPAARPFSIYGPEDSRARAVDCLAAAVYYEAGDDAVGERAVAQVIINRARHPAFPKTICGVVFQGSERSTGCQFTFACDGAMLRYSPSAAAWERARYIARTALNGSVYKPVGHATHYHTDWVVPYWSASLEKITEVHTHLFFRWTGWWGTPPAFNRTYAGIEPNIALMARLSPGAFQNDPALEALLPGAVGTDGAFVDPASIPQSAVPAPMAAEGGDSNNFMLTLPKTMNPDAFAALAIRTCGERPYCKFMAWADAKQTPARLPLSSAQVSTMSFSYLRDETQGFAKALWNCGQFRRPSPVQCMRTQVPAQATPAPATAAVAAPLPGATPPVVPAPLAGVRRKIDAVPPPAGTPAEGKGAVSFTLPAPKPSPTPRPTPEPR